MLAPGLKLHSTTMPRIVAEAAVADHVNDIHGVATASASGSVAMFAR